MVALVAGITYQHFSVLSWLPKAENKIKVVHSHMHSVMRQRIVKVETCDPTYLQVWHTLQSGHCHPARLMGVAPISKHAA